MVKAKAAAADVRIPQNRDEAAAMIKEYDASAREVARIESAMNAALIKTKADAEAKAKPHVDRAVELFKGLQLYCEANRQQLLGNSGLKTVDFGTGAVKWRWNPPKVRITGGEEAVVDRIAAKKAEAMVRNDVHTEAAYGNFLRVKIEIDKEAMLKDPALARTIEGVSIGRGGETFEVEPFGAEISEAAQ